MAGGGGREYHPLVFKKGSNMKLTIDITEKGTVLNSEGGISYDELVSICMAILEHSTKTYIKEHKLKQHEKESLYDALDTIFYRFMERAFPGIQPRDFDFSDAAVLFAQDMIINKARAENKTFEQVMKEFEAEAKAYVKQKGRIS